MQYIKKENYLCYFIKEKKKFKKKIDVVDKTIKQKEIELKEACEKELIETAAFLRQQLMKLYRKRKKLDIIRNKSL